MERNKLEESAAGDKITGTGEQTGSILKYAALEEGKRRGLPVTGRQLAGIIKRKNLFAVDVRGRLAGVC